MNVLTTEFEKSASKIEESPRGDLPEICFLGRSNVGKSSALNALTRRHRLARVSKTPGRTRLLNFFRVELMEGKGQNKRTESIRLCDVPGYGYAKASADERRSWGVMIEGYLKGRDSLAAVVVLIDALVGVQPKDLEMLEFLTSTPRPLVIAATKADRLPRTRRSASLDKIARALDVPRNAVIAFSSHEDIGHRELWMTICAAAGLFNRQSDRILEPAPPESEDGEQDSTDEDA